MCDDGSRDDTESRMLAWERRDERVHYVRASRNSGKPATTRNLGIERAQGDWIAFLDDDDEWLPGKLASQRATLETEDVDVVATNALCSDGSAYFSDAPTVLRPTRTDLLRANPIITSSTLVRRESLISTSGFRVDNWMRGIEDYVAWLELADRGARFLILGEPLVRYDDTSSDRLSIDRVRIQIAVARATWIHALRRPRTSADLRSAFRHSADVAYVAGGEALARLQVGAGEL